MKYWYLAKNGVFNRLKLFYFYSKNLRRIRDVKGRWVPLLTGSKPDHGVKKPRNMEHIGESLVVRNPERVAGANGTRFFEAKLPNNLCPLAVNLFLDPVGRFHYKLGFRMDPPEKR